MAARNEPDQTQAFNLSFSLRLLGFSAVRRLGASSSQPSLQPSSRTRASVFSLCWCFCGGLCRLCNTSYALGRGPPQRPVRAQDAACSCLHSAGTRFSSLNPRVKALLWHSFIRHPSRFVYVWPRNRRSASVASRASQAGLSQTISRGWRRGPSGIYIHTPPSPSPQIG